MSAIRVPLYDLRAALQAVLPNAGTDYTLPLLAALRIEWDGRRLLFAATDRVSLGMYRVEVASKVGAWGVTVARPDVRRILSAFPAPSRRSTLTASRPILLTVDDRGLHVTDFDPSGKDPDAFESTTVRCRGVEGQYPDVRKLFKNWLAVEDKVVPEIALAGRMIDRITSAPVMPGMTSPVRLLFAGAHKLVVLQTEDPRYLGAVMPCRRTDGGPPAGQMHEVWLRELAGPDGAQTALPVSGKTGAA